MMPISEIFLILFLTLWSTIVLNYILDTTKHVIEARWCEQTMIVPVLVLLVVWLVFIAYLVFAIKIVREEVRLLARQVEFVPESVVEVFRQNPHQLIFLG